MTTNAVRTTTPTLFGVEGDAFVFVAVREDPTLGGDPNWLSQTFHVDPDAGADDEFRVDVTERYHVDGMETQVAFEDRFTVILGVDSTACRVPPVRRRLERWYRHAYLDDGSPEVAVGLADGEG
jgi:hypothetical protein